MTDTTNASPIPTILETNPPPRSARKSFHGRRIQVWEGLANVNKINGWVDNPRLDIELKRFKKDNAGRKPTNDEILNIMVTVKEFNIKTLADDLRDNGIRQPIIISNDGRLLDGNRRYFATLYLVSKTPADDPNFQDYLKVPVWVLQESNPDDETRILVQENFYSSLKVEWGDYVKATHIYNDLQDGLSVLAVSQKYGWGKPKVNETKKIMELIDEFKNFATLPGDEGLGMEELDAEQIAAEKYQFFNEAQKSFYTSLSTNYEFKTQFFRQIANNTFSSFQEVRIAWDAWQDSQAREILESGKPGAAKKAKALLEYKNFHTTGLSKAEDNIGGFVKFLNQLTSAQMTALTPESLNHLAECLQRVIDMANAAKSGKGSEVKAEVPTTGIVRITGTYSEIGPLKANIVQMVGTQGILKQTREFIEISLESYVAVRKDTGGTVEETPELDGVVRIKEQEYADHAASRDLVYRILEADQHTTGDDHWDGILDAHQGVAVNCMTVPGLLGLCLFDEQGTGKTITGLAAFDLLKKSGVVDALLITAPKTLLENWKDEAQKFLPFIPNIYIASGDREARYRALGSEYDIYLLTYENLISDIESLKSLAKTKRLLLAMDESFFIKNPDAKRSMAAMELRGYCQRCFVLCGTPAPNQPSDLVHQFTMADNGYAFGGAATQKSQALEDFAAIESIIDSRGVYLRRTKKSVLPDLPEKDFKIVDLDMSPKQRSLYDEAKKELILYLKSLDNKTFKRNLTTYFQKRNALLQICIDPSLIDPLYNETPCKFAYLESALPKLIEIEREKVVIWSVYTKTIDRIARSFARYNPARIDGKVAKVAERQLMVERFQMDESCRVFVGNPAAAGAGITLHKAKTSIYLSYSNQAAHYMQSLDRTHRRGQTANSVNYLFLVAKDTIEVNEIKRLIEKQGRQSDLLGDPVAERIELADILNELEHG